MEPIRLNTYYVFIEGNDAQDDVGHTACVALSQKTWLSVQKIKEQSFKLFKNDLISDQNNEMTWLSESICDQHMFFQKETLFTTPLSPVHEDRLAGINDALRQSENSSSSTISKEKECEQNTELKLSTHDTDILLHSMGKNGWRGNRLAK